MKLSQRRSDGPFLEYEMTDDRSGLRAHLAIMERQARPAFGGIRCASYRDDAEAAQAARSLATMMGQKIAFAELPHGGAKTVVESSLIRDRRAAFEALAEAVEALHGAYVCGPDMGTDDADLHVMRSMTSYVNHDENAAGPSTAEGVMAGIRAAVQLMDWPEGLKGRTVFVEGAGSVGASLVPLLLDELATVWLYDIDVQKAEHVVQAAGAHGARVVVAKKNDLRNDADIFAPCSVGGTVGEWLLDDHDPSIICGSANNQLASRELASKLHDAGTLFVPDFCVNAGAVIEGISVFDKGEEGRDLARMRINATQARVASLLAKSASQHRPPLFVAEEGLGGMDL